MAIKERKPVTPGQRFQIVDDYSDITKTEPEKSLLCPLKRTAGRDNQGRVSLRHRGGGNKRRYRLIDFKRSKENIPAKVLAIEYDPNRNVRILLIQYKDGEKSYILAPLGVKVGDEVIAGENQEIRAGNAMSLRSIPVGAVVHNVEFTPGQGGRLARSAGAGVAVLAKEGNYAILKLPSGEQRMIHLSCRATIGQLGNLEVKNISLGKAGKKRHLGRRPEVRGVAMNPCDHPHGGGEGRSGIGRKHPVSPWGKVALGGKTRNPRKVSNRFILARRPK